MVAAGATALHANGRLYVAGLSADLLAAVRLTNSAPVVDSVRIEPAAPLTSNVLRASVVAHDGENDPLTFRYEWHRNGALLSGATSQTLDLAQPGNGDRGDRIEVIVIASDGQSESTPGLTSTWTVTVGDAAPTVGVSLNNTAPRTRDILTATASGSDVDGEALTYTFTWKVDGLVRATTSGPNASSSLDLAVAGNGNRGQTVRVEVVASDGTLQSSIASASTVVVNSAPTVTVKLNSTTPRSNDVLVATASAQDADADPLTLSYTWRVNGVTKQAGPSRRFDLGVRGHGDRRDVITVTVTASDGTASATAGATATVR